MRLVTKLDSATSGLDMSRRPQGVTAFSDARRWARNVKSVIGEIDDHVELAASDLLRDSDFTTQTLARAIRDLNNSAVAFLVWDREADVIQDGRLRAARIQVEDCGACGAKISMNVRFGCPEPRPLL